MIKHYLAIAGRQLIKNKLYSAITVVGLGVGLASVFLIINFLAMELSFDRFHNDPELLYRIVWEDENPQTRTPHPMAQAMVRDFPEVENAVSFTPIWGPGLIRQTFSVRNLEKDLRYDESNVLSVDTTFFKVFNFPLEKGDPTKALQNPGGILISSSMARKYFGDEEPMGKHLAINDDRYLVEVVGVFKDVPKNSHFHFDILGSYLREKQRDPSNDFYSWKDFGHYNYIRLQPGADAKALEARLLDWIPTYLNWTPEDIKGMKDQKFGFRLQPVTDIHLTSHLHWELENNGNISYVYMMAAGALLILVIGCINFINLTTAQSTERSKEIGIRKSLGAFRQQLTAQFIGESILIASMAIALAALLVEMAVPFYHVITGYELEMNYFYFLGSLIGMGLATGILAGAYPALYLSSLKPGLILKGKFLNKPEGSIFRHSFMVFQFFASMVLISSSLIIVDQLDYIQGKGLGFQQDEVIILPIKNRGAINPKFDAVQTELQKIPGVKAVTASSNVPGRPFNQNPVMDGNDHSIRINASEATVDYRFFETLDIPLSEGRLFMKENPADAEAFVINEAAAKSLFHSTAIGKVIDWDKEDAIHKGTIIGVVKDFHYQSLHEPIRPLLFRIAPQYNYVLVKMDTREFEKTLSSIKSTWKKFDDRFGFEFAFLSEDLNQQYTSEQNMASVMIVFAFLAAVIACFGLLGMAALSFRNKVKEVSVRKVLGASLFNLTTLLLKDFNRTILAAVVLAVPFAIWMMNSWLDNFAYRIHIGAPVFILSACLLVFVAWATLGYLTLKISKVNPAETLKSE